MNRGIFKLALLGIVLCFGGVVASKGWRDLSRDREKLIGKNSDKAARIEALNAQVAALREHRDRNKRMYLHSRDAELKFKQAWLDQEGRRFFSVVDDPALGHLGDSQKKSIDGFRKTVSALLYSKRDLEGATIAGRDGWLYLKNELHTANATNALYEGALEGIQNIHQSLQGRGIQLVLCPLPTKWELHPEGITGVKNGEVDLNPQRSVFVQQLRDAGVTCVDLAPIFREAIATGKLERAYFREDTHWPPQAIAIAANALTEVIDSHPTWEGSEGAATAAALTQRRHAGILKTGDLSHMLPDSSDFESDPESFEYDEIVGYENRPGRVLVTGRSFTAIDPAGAKNAGLAPQMAFGLRSDVQHLYGGPGALRKLLKKEPENFSELRFIVWVLPGRDFWESDQLFSPEILWPDMFGESVIQAKSSVAAVPASEHMEPELLVTAASPELLKSQLIYRDLISSFVVAEPGMPSRVYYYHLMKDRKFLLPRFIRKGDRVRVDAIPWQEQIEAHPQFERFTIQDSLSDFDQEIFYVRKWLVDPPSAD